MIEENHVSQYDIHQVAREHGWWEGDPNIPEKLALIHEEISEALGHYREGRMDLFFDNGKPDGFGIELADAVIRIRDLMAYLQYDLEYLVRIKHEYNKSRPYRHGNKRA